MDPEMDVRMRDDGPPSDDSGDADSDLEELQGEMARREESIRDFLATHHGESGIPATRGGPRGRGARGPRKAAKPRGDITARLSKVNQAFLAGEYDRAQDLAFEVIRINAETHQAWTALSSIFDEQGDPGKALSAMVYAAHLRPKDVGAWMRCASYALDTIGEDEDANLHTARLCYSAALRADPEHMEARMGKAAVCHRQGHIGLAVQAYSAISKRRPRDLDLVRKLAEACVDTKHAETTVPTAITAYRRYFDLEIADASSAPNMDLWHDIGIYVDLYASTGRVHEAVRELKGLARWLVGRPEEQFWDTWQVDDREWDVDDVRRREIPELSQGTDETLHGQSLPLDLRIRLAIYRLKMENVGEALQHIHLLEPGSEYSMPLVEDFAFLIFDLACELTQHGQPELGRIYLEQLRSLPGPPDPLVLLHLGRCYLALGESSAAEDAFLAAIDADELSIEPRIELANMYETAKEGEEALILAAEAMAIREAQGQGAEGGEAGPSAGGAQGDAAVRNKMDRVPQRVRRHIEGLNRPVIPRRYRAKRLADPEKRRRDEQTQALKLARQYELVTDLKRRIVAGEKELVPDWLSSSGELFDEFRSLKKFYSWDKYLHFLAPQSGNQEAEEDGPATELARLYQRLSRTVNPGDEQSGRAAATAVLDSHQGIPFDKWLDLFLDYAIGLAMEFRKDEAYGVCESARDSTVFQSPEHNFTIHIAWSVCAILTSDEGRAIAVARHLMRDMATGDASRMYALLSSLCHSPVSWYTSGPAQKFILRQIKLIDSNLGFGEQRETPEGGGDPSQGLDVCLLMLYGHILFTSTSYTYALGYFLRARVLDPENSMINFSLGLAYIHYALKRQSSNRQYLLLQGQSFLSKYAEIEGQRPPDQPSSSSSSSSSSSLSGSAASYYNIGRVFHLLGIAYLAVEYYAKALEIVDRTDPRGDIAVMTAANYVSLLMTVRNKGLAMEITKRRLIL